MLAPQSTIDGLHSHPARWTDRVAERLLGRSVYRSPRLGGVYLNAAAGNFISGLAVRIQ